MRVHTFATRLVILLGSTIALTVLNTYIPHGLIPLRVIVAGVQLVFMVATMGATVRWVLEDF